MIIPHHNFVGGAIIVAPKLPKATVNYICYIIEPEPSNCRKWQHNFCTPKFGTLP